MAGAGAGGGRARLRTGAVTVLAPGERLVATMAGVGGIGATHLAWHLDRLATSAAALGVGADVDGWRRAVARAVGGLEAGRSARLRLLVDADGTASVEAAAMTPWAPGPVRLVVDDEPIDERDPRWGHKTTERGAFEDRCRRHGAADDVVLCNRHGQATEVTRASLLVRLDGRWWTPPLSAGCLPGVGRRVLLERGVVGERPVPLSDLRSAQAVAVVSSLRGWRPAVVRW